MAKETVYKCDRCGSRDKKRHKITVPPTPWEVKSETSYHNSEDRDLDLCSSCWNALWKWLEKSNANTPGDRGPGWVEVCNCHIPCGGPCEGSPSWRQVR